MPEIREPEYVNWSKARWDIEEAMEDAATVGAMINADLDRLVEGLPSDSEGWAKHYDVNRELEAFHHDLLALYERARFIGILK
jgi:hypothetical protein